MSANQHYAEFIASTRFADVPDNAYSTIERAFADTVGVMVAGDDDPSVQALRAVASSTGKEAVDRALVWGTAAHALDYDDVAFSCHASAVLVPAILAVADALGSSGEDMALAYAKGFEVLADAALRGGALHEKGWHPTSVIGIFGATAAACSLYKATAEQSQNALAIAASLASGLVINFCSMTKPLHAGLAASRGIFAAQLAINGMTGTHSALDSESGFFQVYSRSAPRSIPLNLGKDWRILLDGPGIKRYPICYASHRSTDTVIDLVRNNNLTVESIASIEIGMGRGQIDVLACSHPKTVSEARFSAQFAIACALRFGRVGMSELTLPVILDDETQALYELVNLSARDDVDAKNPVFSQAENITIRLKDGRILESGEIQYAKGSSKNPLTDQEVWEKFSSCVEARINSVDTRRFFEAASRIKQFPTICQMIGQPTREK